jgi:molybdopterin converting factor small subunit
VQLDIILFAGLKCNNPDLPSFGKREFQLEVLDGTTVGELRGILALDPDIRLLNMVNHHYEKDDWVLEHGDRVGIFPPIGGG